MTDEEKPDAMLLCSPYPAKDKIEHFINMEINRSILGECCECKGEIYIGSGGQEMLTDPEYSVVKTMCVPCARRKHPDAKPEMHEGIRQQLVETLGEEAVKKLESEVVGTPLGQISEDFR